MEIEHTHDSEVKKPVVRLLAAAVFDFAISVPLVGTEARNHSTGRVTLIFGVFTHALLIFCFVFFRSGKGRRRSFVPTPKWCWWAASWT